MMERENKDIGLKELVSSVEKKDIKPLNVLNPLKRLEVVAKILWLVKKLLKHLMNSSMVRT